MKTVSTILPSDKIPLEKEIIFGEINPNTTQSESDSFLECQGSKKGKILLLNNRSPGVILVCIRRTLEAI